MSNEFANINIDDECSCDKDEISTTHSDEDPF
jgi:hypothetical protein